MTERVALPALFVFAACGGSDSGGTNAPDHDAGSASDTAMPVTYQNVALSFDDVPTGSVTSQYAEYVQFGTAVGSTVYVYDLPANAGQSPPNVLTASSGVPGTSDSDLYVDFVKPVRDLKLRAIAVNDGAGVAKIRIYEMGSLADTISVNGMNSYDQPILLDLTNYDDVSRIEIVEITDYYGISWDDFTFQFPD